MEALPRKCIISVGTAGTSGSELFSVSRYPQKSKGKT
jgi:hypothetical protein